MTAAMANAPPSRSYRLASGIAQHSSHGSWLVALGLSIGTSAGARREEPRLVRYWVRRDSRHRFSPGPMSGRRGGSRRRGDEGGLPMNDGVLEMRLVVTAADYDDALTFYRDVLRMPEIAAFTSENARVAILDAGRATLELADPPHAAFVDEVEVGRRVAGHVRVAFQVTDAKAATDRVVAAGAELIAAPTETPWRSLNSRLNGPAGLQLTLFEELDPPAG